MRPDMFSGYGVRTLSSEHPAYNPFSYHLGSVWPVENATIALGMARYGFWKHAQRVAEGTFAASALFADHRLPEVLGGSTRDPRQPHPGIYPHANAPQGWSASAVIMMIQVLLGLRAAAPLNTLLLEPHLPPWLPDLTLRGVRVGGSSVDLRARRTAAGRTRCRVRAAGDVLISLRAPPQIVL